MRSSPVRYGGSRLLLVYVFGGCLRRPGESGLAAQTPIMPRLKQSFEHAAHNAGGGYIDTDHLLVGITHVHGALAMSILRSHGIRPDVVRASVEERRRRAS